jgi:hypothetical protein
MANLTFKKGINKWWFMLYNKVRNYQQVWIIILYVLIVQSKRDLCSSSLRFVDKVKTTVE